jgi:hypothetical protein
VRCVRRSERTAPPLDSRRWSSGVHYDASGVFGAAFQEKIGVYHSSSLKNNGAKSSKRTGVR